MKTLYEPQFEHDNCGVGSIININGKASHDIVSDALSIVENLEHRAGKDAEGQTGDGVGILTQIPHKFMVKAARECNIKLGRARSYAVGMIFFPQNELLRMQAMKMFEIISAKEGAKFLGWRCVPVRCDVLGQRALEACPAIYQCFLERPKDIASDLDFDRKLYVIRRVFEHSNEDTYVVSLSCRTIVY
ncbi:MAG: glutamate synthase subunit alpha, partial [Lachnospiraceae bacterium]|nr:glutamate synthase subunit alpha [Lachnospiraceae bacterium]